MGRRVGGVVGSGVVVGTQEAAVLEVGVAALVPGGGVVGVAHAGWPVASLGGTTAVADRQRGADRVGVEARAAGDVEDLGGSPRGRRG